MRRVPGLAVLLLLVLVACAETPQPTLPPEALPTAAPATDAAPLPTAPATDAQPAPSGLPASPSPLASPGQARPLPTPTGAAPASPWPAYLRALDFGIPAGNSYAPGPLVAYADLDRVYVRTRPQDSNDPGQVTVLDGGSGQVLAVVETGLDSYGEGILAVDPTRGHLYAANAGDSTASILDADSLEAVATLQGVDNLALDAEGERLYVAGFGGLRVLDTASRSILHEVPVSYAPRFLALASAPGGMGRATGRVYLAYREGDGHVLGQYDADSLQALATTDLPGPVDGLAPDPKRDLVYVTLNDGERNLLWTVDGEGTLAAERDLGEWTQKTRLALDPEGDCLFLGREDYKNHGITVLDLESGQALADIALARSPNALAWDAGVGRLLVSHTYDHQIGVVDIDGKEVTDVYPTALDLVGLAVDPERGHLYVTDTAGRLHVLDSDSDEELATLPGEGRIAVDVAHGRVYTGGEGASVVRFYDADRLEQEAEIQTRARPVADAYHGELLLVRNGVYLTSLETLTVTTALPDTLPETSGYSPNPSAVDAVVDAGSGRLFAIINNGVPGSNNGNYLYVYEPETYQKVLTDTERSPIYVDVDPATGRAYVSRIHMVGRSTSLLEDGNQYTARLEAAFGPLRVDAGLGRVYLSATGQDEGYLLVLDATNLNVLGGVAIPGGFALRALDPQRHLLYLATGDGRVQIWSATGGSLPGPVDPARSTDPLTGAQRFFPGPGDAPLFATTLSAGGLYRSDDEGGSWADISGGPPTRAVQQVAVSAGFREDQTLFAATLATDQGLGLWKSTDGGRSWRMANRGLSDLAIHDLALSPAFATDQTIFAVGRRAGLYRSTDGGETWTPLSDRYRAASPYGRPASGVSVSPTYDRDGTLFVIHDGLYRSTDGGETWARVLDSMTSLALSPEFAADHTLFGWSDQGGLLRSTDGGDTWQPASTGLALGGFGSARAIVAPDFGTSRTVYLIWTPSAPGGAAQFFRSPDAGETWQRLADDPPQGATPVRLSADGAAFLALDEEGRMARWPVADLNWQPTGLPTMAEIEVYDLVASPAFAQDRTLYAVSEGAGVLRSGDGGLTWTDTGFPLRVTFGRSVDLVAMPPKVAFVGTALGLYHYDGGEGWMPVGGGLPPGVAASSPEIGADGSLRVLAGSGDDDAQRLFLSTDGGQTWTEPVPALPQKAGIQDLRLSPAFAADRTAILTLGWDLPWRTRGGGTWQPLDLPGEGPLSALHLSPAFDQDGLVFVRLQDNSLWRSTDGGDTWAQSGGDWGGEAPMGVTASDGYSLDALTFSPDFGRDGVILIQAGDALYRSGDGGATWTQRLELAPRPAQAAFAPDYAESGTIYLLQGGSVYRSTDRGRSWRSRAPVPWGDGEEVKLLLSPTIDRDETMVAWTMAGQVYVSTDGGLKWREISPALPPAGIQEILFSPDHAGDGLIYLVPIGPGLYKWSGEGPWLPVTDEVPPTPARPPTPTPIPRPTITPAPPTCASQPVRFLAVWQQAGARLGCPQEPATQVTLAEQPFEYGRMIWDSTVPQIYVLLDSGRWQAYDDTYDPDVDPAYDAALPPPPQQPQRGFGKVWREELEGPLSAIGWALEVERAVGGWRQRFDGGLLVWTDAVPAGAGGPGAAYLLYDDGTWEVVPAPGP